ncbi:MAG: aldolase/citrate lyase family protein, partial [Candidatus Omnitrophota bacterium]|nr:aldolase/citrate lyase family protein [Candidatus Omnitrophota bacterium]
MTAVVSDGESPFTHPVVVLSSKIPVVTQAKIDGKEKATEAIKTGDRIIVDEINGIVYVNPSIETEEAMDIRRAEEELLSEIADELKNEPARTLDGSAGLDFAMDVTDPMNFSEALSYGIKDVGLLRAELLYQERQELPGEEELARIFTNVSNAAEGTVTIRMFDMQPDKKPRYLADSELKGAAYLFSESALEPITKPLARAILRAYDLSDKKNIRVLFPMVESEDEAIKIRELMKAIDSHSLIKMGCMIESRDAAAKAKNIIKHFDFVYVGTNDLINNIKNLKRRGALEVPDMLLPVEFARIARLLYRVCSSEGKELTFCGMWAGLIKTIVVILRAAAMVKRHAAEVIKVVVVAKPDQAARLKHIVRFADIRAIMRRVTVPMLRTTQEGEKASIVKLGYGYSEFDREIQSAGNAITKDAITDAFDRLSGENAADGMSVKTTPQPPRRGSLADAFLMSAVMAAVGIAAFLIGSNWPLVSALMSDARSWAALASGALPFGALMAFLKFRDPHFKSRVLIDDKFALDTDHISAVLDIDSVTPHAVGDAPWDTSKLIEECKDTNTFIRLAFYKGRPAGFVAYSISGSVIKILRIGARQKQADIDIVGMMIDELKSKLDTDRGRNTLFMDVGQRDVYTQVLLKKYGFEAANPEGDYYRMAYEASRDRTLLEILLYDFAGVKRWCDLAVRALITNTHNGQFGAGVEEKITLLSFRDLKRSDLPEIARIEESILIRARGNLKWIEEDFILVLRNGIKAVVAAEYRDEIVGYALFFDDYRHMTLLKFGTHPKYALSGVADEIVEHFKRLLSGKGIVLDTAVGRYDKATQKFLKMRGFKFKPDEVLPSIFGPGLDGIRMFYISHPPSRHGRPENRGGTASLGGLLMPSVILAAALSGIAAFFILSNLPQINGLALALLAGAAGMVFSRSHNREEGKWVVFDRFVRKLNTVDFAIIEQAEKATNTKEKRKILADIGLEEADQVDASYFVSAIRKVYEKNRTTNAGRESLVVWTDLLSFGGIGRYLVCYKEETGADGLVAKIPNSAHTLSYANIYTLNGAYVAQKRLGNGLAADFMIIEAREGSKKPFVFYAVNKGRTESSVA